MISSQVAWWDAATITNIISEVAIVALEVAIMLPLQVPRPRKASIISLFACRLLYVDYPREMARLTIYRVACVAVIQLYYFHEDSTRYPLRTDFALGYWRSTICTQIVQCIAIVTTSLPYAKLFMESFESGLIRVDDLRRKGEFSTEGSGKGSGRGSGKASGKGYELLDISRNGQRDGITTTTTFGVEEIQS